VLHDLDFVRDFLSRHEYPIYGAYFPPEIALELVFFPAGDCRARRGLSLCFPSWRRDPAASSGAGIARRRRHGARRGAPGDHLCPAAEYGDNVERIETPRSTGLLLTALFSPSRPFAPTPAIPAMGPPSLASHSVSRSPREHGDHLILFKLVGFRCLRFGPPPNTSCRVRRAATVLKFSAIHAAGSSYIARRGGTSSSSSASPSISARPRPRQDASSIFSNAGRCAPAPPIQDGRQRFPAARGPDS